MGSPENGSSIAVADPQTCCSSALQTARSRLLASWPVLIHPRHIRMKKNPPAPITRTRRAPEQLIADLQKRIEAIKARAEQKKIKKSPVLRHVRSALKSVDKALSESKDTVTRRALGEARSTLSACLSLGGVAMSSDESSAGSRDRRSTDDISSMSDRLLDYVTKHSGERGEQIAAALGTDTKTMRLPMRKLIGDGKIRTTGERRGMTYFST